MKAKELIKHLNKLDPEQPIYIYDDQSCGCPAHRLAFVGFTEGRFGLCPDSCLEGCDKWEHDSEYYIKNPYIRNIK